jgi:hypothetical protein
MDEILSFRCLSQSEPAKLWTICVSLPSLRVRCDCPGFNDIGFCSHIDATLVAGERAMISEENRTVASELVQCLDGSIVVPPGWKSNWRRNLIWRGFGFRASVRRGISPSEMPVVCFTGKFPEPRKALVQRAERMGWEAIDRAHSKIDVLVAENAAWETNKLRFARECGISVLSYEEWMMLTPDGEVTG